ncbi:MAG: TauD/TfdA family dioxygenase, partial [Alphaproteobacteria bacterium]|nr:TauD/TfdA family dioxygenase [Alphaproteobacteria bacterium]
MTLETHALRPHFAARLTGLDVRRPLAPPEVAAVEQAMDRFAVVVLPAQDITDEQQLAFTRNFGPLEE